MKNSLAIIPARSGSQSIKKKNIKEFCGKPLIYWTIKIALESNFSRVIVSTDSSEIAEIAISFGAEVPFLRSKELSGSEVAIEPVLADVVKKLKATEDYDINCLGLLLPTSPFRKLEDLNKSLELFFNNEWTSIVSVSNASAGHNPFWMLRDDINNKVTMFNGDELSNLPSRRQDLPTFYIKNDFIFSINPNNLFEEKPNLYGPKPKLMLVSDDRLDIDINTPKDWKIAEKLFKHR